MAKQRGIIKLDGTMADITFYRTKHGYMAKEKLRVPPGRILNDPRFARTRENMAEFGRACNAARVLRNAMGTLLTSFGGKNLLWDDRVAPGGRSSQRQRCNFGM